MMLPALQVCRAVAPLKAAKTGTAFASSCVNAITEEPSPAAAPLEVGAAIPQLRLPDTHGTHVALADGERALLVVFLPMAFSPVCGREAAELAEVVASDSLGADVLAITCDSMFTLRAWDEAEKLGFPLLSDFWPHGAVSRAFGVFDETAGIPLRASFLLSGAEVRWRVVNPGGTPRRIADYHQAIAAL